MRRSVLYLWLTTTGLGLLFGLLLIHPALTHSAAEQRIILQRQLTTRLGLTDVCLFTEAPYLRHPNLADRFTPFQNHPLALSHFPSESFLAPPVHVRQPARTVAEGLKP